VEEKDMRRRGKKKKKEGGNGGNEWERGELGGNGDCGE